MIQAKIASGETRVPGTGLRIAIVTEEFAGVTGGGGIGTCARGLCIALSDAGYEVEVVITHGDFRQPVKYQNVGSHQVKLISLAHLFAARHYGPGDSITKAYFAYEYLAGEDYDIVHCNEWRGSGYFLALAKRQGLVRSYIITHTHGSSEWVRKHNSRLPDLHDLELEAIERAQIENSDLVVSPSRYLLDWYQQGGVRLPEHVVINWILPQWVERADQARPTVVPLSTSPVRPGTINELIFFGRHEPRKGFPLFLKAVASRPELSGLSLTFIGRFDRIEREFTGSMALRHLAGHAGRIKFINTLAQKEALDYIGKRPHALCVMPSLIENSPCTVGECFTLGVPFIAGRVGGTGELLRADSVEDALCPTEVDALAEALQSAVLNGMPTLISTLDPEAIVARWTELHKQIRRRLADVQAATQATAPTPLVTICLVHYERPSLLRRALKGIAAQTYGAIEVVLVDDGSRSKAAQAMLESITTEAFPFPIKVVRSKNRYLGAARNLAAQHAQGEWLIFHDDDNIAEPHQVETFVRAALNGGYDVLTSQYLVFEDSDGPESATVRFFPMGLGGTFSFFRNRFGDANCLIKREVFQAIGGFTELRGVGWEDWELFLKLHLAGYRMALVPEPLFRYRVSGDGMLATGSLHANNRRIFDAAAHATAFDVNLLEYARRAEVEQLVLDKTWDMLGRQQFGELHRNLMAADPNGDPAREKLFDLAVSLGRIDDAVELGLTSPFLREKLFDLVRYSRNRRFTRLEVTARTEVLTPDGAGAVYVEGWLSDPGLCLQDRSVRVGSDLYRIAVCSRVTRHDVSRWLKMSDELLLGFRAILLRLPPEDGPPPKPDTPRSVRPNPLRFPILSRRRAAPSSEKSARWSPPGLELANGTQGGPPIVIIPDGKPLDVTAIKGHVDAIESGSYYDVTSLKREGREFTGRLEIAVAQASRVLACRFPDEVSEAQFMSDGLKYLDFESLDLTSHQDEGPKSALFVTSHQGAISVTIYEKHYAG
jgi:glycosyltransferase involved in cell wall biosynthesis